MGVFLRFSPLRGMEYEPDLQEEWLPEGSEWQDGKIAPGKTCYDWPCYFLWRSLIVNSNGKAARCLIYQNVAEFGDLNVSTVRELYNGPDTQRARQLFSRGDVPAGDFPQPCNNCGFYARTQGGQNLTKPQSLERPPPASGKATIPLKMLP